MAIDIGAPAINGNLTRSSGVTMIETMNPANASGVINSVEIWANTNMSGVRVGTFYTTNGNTLKCRDSATIGAVASGSKQTFTEDSGSTSLAIAVETGDYFGIYWTGGTLEADYDSSNGYPGHWYANGEYIDPDDETGYGLQDSYALSFYGTGEEAGGATPQAVGDGSIAIAATLGRNISIGVGAGSISIAGVLGRLTKIGVGDGSITIAGALTATLTFLQVVGSGAIAIAGTLNRLIKVSVGAGSISIAGALGRLIKVSVGAGSITIAGALGLKTLISVGAGSVSIAGSLAAGITGLFYQAVGGGSVAITGALNGLFKFGTAIKRSSFKSPTRHLRFPGSPYFRRGTHRRGRRR